MQHKKEVPMMNSITLSGEQFTSVCWRIFIDCLSVGKGIVVRFIIFCDLRCIRASWQKLVVFGAA